MEAFKIRQSAGMISFSTLQIDLIYCVSISILCLFACSQDRVYEERCFAENSASANLMPAGKTPSSSSISRSPLSTIG